MDSDFGADIDQFEIHISDSESPEEDALKNLNENSAPVTENSLEVSVHPHVEEEEKINGNGVDHLRASLSDVVLTQSLEFSARRIDLDDENETAAEQYGAPDHGSTPAQTDQFPPPPPFMMTQQSCDSAASSQQGELQLDDIAADFEDAMNPPLLTSTLKAADQDSDDEFDFDLPGSKADKGKSVRFSGDFEEEPVKAGDEVVEKKEAEKPKLSEVSGNMAEPVPPLPQTGKVEIMMATRGTLPESGDGPCQGIDNGGQNQVEDDEEAEDRRHIITSTAADWDNVQTVQAGYTDAPGDSAELMSNVPPLLTFSDIWQHFRTMDHSAVKDKIQVTTEKKGFVGFVSRLFGPPRLHKDLHADRELAFCMAATAFDNGDTQHVQSLQTIYRVLTGSRFNCPRYGSHWEEIGFQGRDPATDLRGTGMLALVQLVNLLQDDSTAQLARDLYKLSLHPTQNFPFCVMCINICRIVLQALREGVLNRECNSQKRVMPVVNQYYAGTLLYLYRVWQQGKTISDSGFVIKDVETRAKKHSKEVLRDLQMYIAGQNSGPQPHPAFGSMELKGSDKVDENVNFFNVVKSGNKTAAELY